MSEIVVNSPNFTMPKGCHDCKFAEWHYIWAKCKITNNESEDPRRRPDYCPLERRK